MSTLICVFLCQFKLISVCMLYTGEPLCIYWLEAFQHLKLNLQFSLREGQRSRLQMFSYGVSLEVRIVDRGGGRIKGKYALLSTCTGRCIVSDPPPPLQRTLWIVVCIPLIRQFISTFKRHKVDAIHGPLITPKR